MAQQPMYPAINNSTPTTLVTAITATDTSIWLLDTSVLPPAPNLATIGNDSDEVCEVVLYTDIVESTLMGVVRGYGGSEARMWAEGTEVARRYTRLDHDVFVENIRDLEARKMGNTEDGSQVTATFAQAAARENVASGQTLATLWGKVMRFFSDLRAGAFAAIGKGPGDVAAGDHTHDEYLEVEGTGIPGQTLMPDGDGAVWGELGATVAVEGVVPQLTGVIEGTPLDVTLKIVTPQDGVPTPDAPVPLEGVERVSVWRGRKNLFDKMTAQANSYINASNGEIGSLAATSASASIPVHGGMPLIYGGDSTNRSNGGAVYDANGAFITGYTTASLKAGIVTPANARSIRITVTTADRDVVQLEVGAIATGHEDYQGETFEVLLPEAIYGLEDVADEVDLAAGTVTKRADAPLFDGTESWTYYATQPNDTTLARFSLALRTAPAAKGLCTHFPWITNGASGTAYECFSSGGSGSSIFVFVKKERMAGWDDALPNADKVALLKAWLAAQYASATPVKAVYELATPVTTSISPVTIPALSGRNTLFMDAGGTLEVTGERIPAWAMQPEKPAYTAEDVGAVPTTRKVNGKELSADVTIGATDVGAAAAAHTHAAGDITSGTMSTSRLPTIPLTKGGTGATTAGAGLENLGGVPATRTVNGKALTTDIALEAGDVGAASATHTHAATDISSGTVPAARLPTIAVNKGGTGATTAAAALTALGAAAVTHTHAAADITSGTLDSARLPTVPVSKGGTGATTAAAGLAALGGVPAARTINSKALSANVVLEAADVGAAVPAAGADVSLKAIGWSGGVYTHSNALILSATQIGRVVIAQTATAAQYDAFAKAQMQVTSQTVGVIKLTARGMVPTIDIPVRLEVFG